jgi:ornithine carbamoyltransferase
MTWPADIPAPRAELRGRSLLTLQHHSPDDVEAILELGLALKRHQRPWPHLLSGRVIGLIFERPSTRTRVSFEAGIARLGGTATTLHSRDLQLGRGETVEDTGKVLGRMLDALVLRTGAHEILADLDAAAGVPVINGLTHAHHPCQALADAMTLRERFGDLSGLPVAWVGDGNNVCVSLLIVGALTGMVVSVATPADYAPPPEVLEWADDVARQRGGRARATLDPVEAVTGAAAIYTDTWVSMGDEEEAAARRETFSRFRLDDTLLGAARSDAVALHCLPAHHGDEITYDVLHGPRSAVWDQAENRLHAQAALLAHALA